jgi:hypothetical protein
MTRNIVLVVLCLAVALVTVHAQSNYAVVRGSILDPQHRPIAGARVHVTAKGTGAEREVVSGATGLYEIAGLQPGAYMLAVDSPGFKQATADHRPRSGPAGHSRSAIEPGPRYANSRGPGLGRVAQNAGCECGRSGGSAVCGFAAAEWPHVDRPGSHRAGSAHQPRRFGRRHEFSLLEAGPAVGGEHRRKPPQRKLLSPRRRHQHRPHLQHSES